MVAATAGHEQLCLLLLSHMPSPLLVNAVGDDAQSLACMNQHIDLAGMIQHYATGAVRSYVAVAVPDRRTCEGPKGVLG